MGFLNAFFNARTALPISPRGPFLPAMVSPLCLHFPLFFLSFLFVSAAHLSNNQTELRDLLQLHHQPFPRRVSRRSCSPSPPPLPDNCFPAVGFNTPSEVPASLDGWWCDPADEFGFLGFSYEITPCEFPPLLFPAVRFMNCRFGLIRSEFGPATDRFREHPKDFQQSLRSPLWGM